MDSGKIAAQNISRSSEHPTHQHVSSYDYPVCKAPRRRRFALLFLVVTLLVPGFLSSTATLAYAAPLNSTIILVQDGIPVSGDGYDWNGLDTLELDGLELAVTDGDGIIIPGGSTIVLSGENSILFSAPGVDTRYGILSNAGSGSDLTFTGEGELAILDTTGSSAGNVFTVGIEVVDGSVTFGAGAVVTAGASECAIRADGNVTADNASITALATGTPDGCTAIHSTGGDIIMTSSSVNANTNGVIGRNNALLTTQGNIVFTDCAVYADASEDIPDGSGVGIYAQEGNITILRGSVKAAGAQDSFGDAGMWAGSAALVPDTNGHITLDNTVIEASGYGGVLADGNLNIRSSQVTSQGGMAALSSGGALTIDSSSVLAEQAGPEGSGIHSFTSLSITNSTVEAYAQGSRTHGVEITGIQCTLTVNTSRLVAQGDDAGIVIVHFDVNDPVGPYVILGEGMAVLEGGVPAFMYVDDPFRSFSLYSYSADGSLGFDLVTGYVLGASKRVVIGPQSAPSPVIPATGDNLLLPGIGLAALGAALTILLLRKNYR